MTELTSILQEHKQRHAERRIAADAARPALARLIECMRHKTGQGYTLRKLLYSLWNGQPASLLDVLLLDWSLRQDFTAVLLGFGFESPEQSFFYDEIRTALTEAGLLDWFIQEFNYTKS